jgi:hypothetical protein
MARFTKAYSGLITRLNEIETLLILAKKSGKTATPTSISQVNSLCRSGVVLLSSHIEGYIEDLSEIALDQIFQRKIPKSRIGVAFRYYLSYDAISDIRKATEPEQITNRIENLLLQYQHVWDLNNPQFSNALSSKVFSHDFSNPSHIKIRKFFNRFGYEQFQRDMQRYLAANFAPCSNMIDQVVIQRNKIAHGDSLTIGTPSDLENMVRLVKVYCRAVDYNVGNWFRNIGCSIR